MSLLFPKFFRSGGKKGKHQRLPLLIKGSCHEVTEGIRTFLFPGALNKAWFYNPSVSRLRETREPAPFAQGSLWVLPLVSKGESFPPGFYEKTA